MATDKVIACVDCKKEFTHTVAEQQLMADRGFRYEPKRCPECRKARKEKNQRPRGHTAYGLDAVSGSSSWGGHGGGGGYDRGPRRDREFRSGGGFGGGRREVGDYSSMPRQSYDAVCATCGQKTTVPFEPTQGRDVYCRDCFQKRKAAGTS